MMLNKETYIECEFDNNKNLVINQFCPEYKDKCAFGEKYKAKCFIRKFYDKHLFRYVLKYKLNEKGKKDIVIILMNPSFADNYYLDNTLYNTKKFLLNLDKIKKIHKVIVLNLFPIRTPNSNNLTTVMANYNEQQENNDNKISEILDKVNDVIVAWGSNYHNIATQKQWFTKLKSKSLYAYGINKKSENTEYGYPKHFSPFAYKYKDEDFKNKTLNNFQVKIIDNGYFEKI